MRGTIRYVLQDFKVCISSEHYETSHAQTYRQMEEAARVALDYSGCIKLISGKDCCPETAFNEFMATKKAYGKDSGMFFYHYDQSFLCGEDLSPKTAHEIALKFAEENYKGYEVLVATHIDKEHMHSHLIINSVSFENGKKLRQTPKTLEQLRASSDKLCVEYGLTTLAPYQKAKMKGLGQKEYRAAMKGSSYKFKLMNAIDECMKVSRTKSAFICNMERLGYGVGWTENRQNITYTMPNGYKCRDIRLHEEKYLKGNMEHEFQFRNTQITKRGGSISFGKAIPADCNGNPRRPLERNAEFDGNRCTDTNQGFGTDRGIGDQRANAGVSESDSQYLQGKQYPEHEKDNSLPVGAQPEAGALILTGWEESREFLDNTEQQSGFLSKPTPVSAVQPVSQAGTLAGIADSLICFGDDLSQITEPSDQQPKKTWKVKERKKGLAQRKDDNSGQDWEQNM